MTEDEKAILSMITNAGESKAKAFEALRLVKKNDYSGAMKLLEEAKKIDIKAHTVQAQLVSKALNKENSDPESISLLMVHAQDHYMSSQLARDLIEELILVFQEKEEEIEKIKLK